ncbi:MAG: hypothetical protein IPP87_11910 [Ideonella sp.]|nr:hypothetical protein [Ideonella sp.]MBL0149370.1 hypothetical protein [Ideonella sp.]
MSDEVTKKDLQSLQGYCNKQIAEVKKLVSDLETKSARDLDKGLCEENKITVNVNLTLRKRLDEVEARLAQLEKRVL